MGITYQDIRELFDAEDWSNPEICVSPLSGEAVVKGYSSIRSKIRYFVGSPFFVDRKDGKDKPISSVPNAAELVVSAEAEPFHFLAREVSLPSGAISELGVFVFENGFALDYEKGKAWQKPQVAAFFDLLKELLSHAPEAGVHLEESTPEPLKKAFQEILRDFLASGLLPD